LLTELIHGLHNDNAVHVTSGRACGLPPSCRSGFTVPGSGGSMASKSARHPLVTAAVLGPSFRLEDAAEMLGETPTALLPR
jgi:hypothetical protein